jgi:hypothetical protein
MKLIYCTSCRDIRALRVQDQVRCFCGASGGQYRGDGLHADISGPCVPLGIANNSFEAALAAAPREDGMGNCFEAFVITEPCDTVHRPTHG